MTCRRLNTNDHFNDPGSRHIDTDTELLWLAVKMTDSDSKKNKTNKNSTMTAYCTFSVRNPDPQSRALHAFKPDGRRLLDSHADEPRLKPARLIMGQHHFIIWRNRKHQKSVLIFYLLFFCFSISSAVSLTCSTLLALAHPAQQCQQLAAIAHTQTQGVVSPPETLKLRFSFGVKYNTGRPACQEG